ncbi:alpha-L-rhamnosidase [Marinoscillum sp. MHG1-6]|uniref:alpha-L-rhamnosidase n=1 Tax=Marinoscillum sp. MHG1-6 TaxID=2959627 RepID=UPI002157A254|nr:alpha-L-rhamnosidase [Marinoscillum sp. MHG1-6]
MQIINLKSEYKCNPLGLSTPSPRLSWEVVTDERGWKQRAYRITASTSSSLDTETLIWDSGRLESDQSIHVEYAGSQLTSGQRVYWGVEVWDENGKSAKSHETAFWEMGVLDVFEWKANWITYPWGNNISESSASPFFRKSFGVEKEIKSARIYAAALGLYELELNGEKVGNEVFTPGWTNYHQRIQYQVYDVTKQLAQGENVVGAVLGDGWYRGHYGWWENNRNTYGDTIALLLQLEIEYIDGTGLMVISDESWKTSKGPILKSDIYDGETYNANLELTGWSTSKYSDNNWQRAKTYAHSKEVLVSSEGDPVRRIQEIKPIDVFLTPKGEQVFDLGQNMVGWVRLQISGQKGQTIVLRFAEVLDQEGNFYTDNLRNIECTDRYILKGAGLEVYEPKFTFHGFRFVMIEGHSEEVSREMITGIVVHSDMQLIGSFECSEPMINQLQSNIQWGQKGNFLDVPTDCPQRDERLGWTGDAQVFAPTASFNFNTAPFFTKWLKDLATEQKEDGSVPWVVPNNIVDGGGTGWSDGYGATGWADAAVIIPWTLYQYYGDTRVLQEQYDSMKGWVDYMIRHSGEELVFDYGFHFGDWLSFAEYYSYHYNAPDYGYAGAHTEKALIATAYFYYSAGLMEKSARLIDEKAYADELNDLLPKIKAAWNREFMTRTGRLVSSTQAAYAIGLVFGIVDDEKLDTISQRLADDVNHFGHLTTGFLGTPVLNYALSDFGNQDLAFMLLNNKRYPSWLYPITKGATTIWERWDGIKPDGTFQTVGMNSFNHYAYGAIGEWLYSRVAGIRIDPEKPGYKNVLFQPLLGGGLTFAKASIHTMYGKVSAGWEVKGDKTSYTVEIPPNCTGTVILPDKDETTLGGKLVEESPDVIAIHRENKTVEINLGSGIYTLFF